MSKKLVCRPLFALNTVFIQAIFKFFIRTQECYLVDAELWFMFFSHATNLKFCMLVQRCLLHLAESSFKSTIKQSFSLPMVIALSTLTLRRGWYCIFLQVLPFHSPSLFPVIPFQFSFTIATLYSFSTSSYRTLIWSSWVSWIN